MAKQMQPVTFYGLLRLLSFLFHYKNALYQLILGLAASVSKQADLQGQWLRRTQRQPASLAFRMQSWRGSSPPQVLQDHMQCSSPGQPFQEPDPSHGFKMTARPPAIASACYTQKERRKL